MSTIDPRSFERILEQIERQDFYASEHRAAGKCDDYPRGQAAGLRRALRILGIEEP